jgi:hypothetical protein
VQTNEVGRSAVLYGGLLVVAAETRKPLRLLEVGASGGLNLRVDRFRYEVGGKILGDAASPVRLVEPWQGRPPAPLSSDVQIVERRGCDPEPIDPGTTEGRLTLMSYVWPDQTERFERLRAAFEVADRVPATVDRAGVGTWLHPKLARRTPGVTTVVWHSVVWQYVPDDERAAMTQALAEAAAAATPDAPLAHLRAEPRRQSDRQIRFELRLTLWPGGEERLLAFAQGHGPPVEWRA